MWQKCPICNVVGQTEVNYTGCSIMTSHETCRVCNGKGIISELTGLPPTYTFPDRVIYSEPCEDNSAKINKTEK